MISELLRTQFAFAHYTLHANLKDLTHADSLLFPPGGGNAINWVLGHIVRSRRPVLTLMRCGKEEEEEEAWLAAYERGSAPLDAADARPLDELLADFDATQTEIHRALDELSPGAFEEEVPGLFGGESQRAIELARLAFHEAYHTGQLGTLRRAIGKDGVLT